MAAKKQRPTQCPTCTSTDPDIRLGKFVPMDQARGNVGVTEWCKDKWHDGK